MAARRHASSASPYEAIVGFSRAVRVGNAIQVSGCAPIEPDGTVTQGDGYAQARRCFAIIQEALADLGASLDDVVRTRIYVTDIVQWEGIARAHKETFDRVRPAATLVQVVALVDPAMLVEIEADAVATDDGIGA